MGGDGIDDETAARARSRGATIVTTYGLTETCGGFTYDGVPLDGMQVRMDAAGVIEVSGSTLMEGYRLDAAATGAAFTTDGWLRTGDVGAIDDDGHVSILGRLDHVIRTGAEKVWPEEVERALSSHPKVRDVAVAGSPDPEWGSHVRALVVPARSEDPPSLEELRAHGAEHLARFKLPRELLSGGGDPSDLDREGTPRRAAVIGASEHRRHKHRAPRTMKGPSPGGVDSGLRSGRSPRPSRG